MLVSALVAAADPTPLSTVAALADRIPFVRLPSGLGPVDRAVLFQIRLPRIALGALVGGLLAAAGAGYPGVSRNPRVDAGMLGAAAGPGWARRSRSCTCPGSGPRPCRLAERTRPGPADRLRAAGAGAAAGHDRGGVRAARPHPYVSYLGGPGRWRAQARRAGPRARPGPAGAAARRADLLPGHRPPAAGPGLGRRTAPDRGPDRAVHLHDLTTAGQYADDLVLLHQGRIEAAGPAASMLTEDRIAR